MPCILTIDDSSTIRTIITKQMTDLGFEVEQAEDGVQGLAKLEVITPDLILLDVTMPVMDGPTMLAKLRESKNTTPVIMLTSESKRAIVAGAMKLGIDDYILKPFKPEELRAKVLKALRVDGAAPSAETPISASPVAPKSAAPAAASSPGLQFTDVLLIDDMENVHKKFRTMLPAHFSMSACVSAREAIQLCQERVYRVVVIDMVIPDINSVALMNQLRALQPHAVMVALALRSANDTSAEVKANGFSDLLSKPFDGGAIDEFLGRHFEVDEVLVVDGNVLTCGKFEGKEEKIERYFSRVRTLARESLEKLASACHDEALIDLSMAPVRNDRLIHLVMLVDKECKRLGLGLRIIGTPDIKRALASVTDTADIPFFETRSAATEAA